MTISMRAFSREIEKQAMLGRLLVSPIQDALYEYSVERPADKERSTTLREKLRAAATDVKVREGGRPVFERRGGQKYVTTRKDEAPFPLAHELGHAEIDDSIVGRLAQSPTGRALPVAIGHVVGAVAMGRQQNAAGLGAIAAGWAPLLAQEALASVKGVRKLREAGATEDELADAKKRMLAAWGSYAAVPVGVAGDILSIGMVIRALSGG